ncbi:MAG: hypothetical protein WCO63_00665 [Bacteroidota bacterium]
MKKLFDIIFLEEADEFLSSLENRFRKHTGYIDSWVCKKKAEKYQKRKFKGLNNFGQI